jgi:hypothetical protein
MLCFEGIAQALNIFRGKSELPNLRLLKIPEDKMQTITVTKDTARIRPYVAGAILRDLKFTKDSYDSLYVPRTRARDNDAPMRETGLHKMAASRCRTSFTKIWHEIERWCLSVRRSSAVPVWPPVQNRLTVERNT